MISNDKQPRARLADFGLNAITFDVFSMSRTSINWTAPEILTPEVHDFKPTFASDIYALGMLVYEVLVLLVVLSRIDRCLSLSGAHWTPPILQTSQNGNSTPGRSG